MQANITPALNSVLSLMAMHKETNNTKKKISIYSTSLEFIDKQ